MLCMSRLVQRHLWTVSHRVWHFGTSTTSYIDFITTSGRVMWPNSTLRCYIFRCYISVNLLDFALNGGMDSWETFCWKIKLFLVWAIIGKLPKNAISWPVMNRFMYGFDVLEPARCPTSISITTSSRVTWPKSTVGCDISVNFYWIFARNAGIDSLRRPYIEK